MTDFDRRKLIKLGGLATVGLAGCGASPPENTTSPTGTTAGGTTGGGTATAGGTGTPGADQLGGEGSLVSTAEVRARVLDEDRGAGKYVFSPAVVWAESGATVTWQMEDMAHSATAYHPDNDRPLRIPNDASPFDSGNLQAGETFEHTFETPGVYNYFCKPHEGLGMVGLVVVDAPQGGPGTNPPADVSQSSAANNLTRLIELSGVAGGGGGDVGGGYSFQDATWDSYWYSLYNMSTNIAMSGNGVLFPHNEQQREAFNQRVPAMLKNADVSKPPVKNPNLNMAAFTKGDPHFTQKPVFDAGDGRPDASTLTWDMSKSSKTVSPASLAWTHLKGVTWAKNFEAHFDTLPTSIAAKFRAQMLTTLAQIGVKATLIGGGPQGNGALTQADGSFPLISGFNPVEGKIVDEQPRPDQHAAMLWFLADLNSLAQNGWFGYVNPEPLIPAKKIQQLTDGMGKATMSFDPSTVVDVGSTRDLGPMLSAVGWYGTHAGSAKLRQQAAAYANDLAAAVESNATSAGKVESGADNQAATQGAVAQGLVWASQVRGVDHTDLAEDVWSYATDSLWDAEAGTFVSAEGESTYAITARDVGDITGGFNAARAALDVDVEDAYATFFNQTINRGRLQRAQRPASVNEGAEFQLPLPPKAGGEFGQAAVYNTAVEYDSNAGEWSVTDRTFDTEQALYLANQEIWISQWGGDYYQGSGVPGESDSPP